MCPEAHAVESDALLTAFDPPAFHISNPDGKAAGVIVCDHASNKVPRRLDSLGLTPACLNFHISYDIGAAGVAERLAPLLDMPAIFSGYSRLVIDMNRPTDDFTSIREISDAHVVPGNRGLTERDHHLRQEELFKPYHDAVEGLMTDKRRRADELGLEAPVVISVHSCTDEMRGVKRPWHIGVLYNRDERLAKAIIDVLRDQNPDLTIGDNKPYSGLDAYGYTIERHALPFGIPNVLFEVRQDLIGTEEGQAKYANILGTALAVVLSDVTQFTFDRV
ncbi:N-formylglutamate amidohydrolase [Hwanghaeella grinnelliae]|uniref:N-formylglutamate amidohydrolase n=1 Tax=Hwanghaeella grinnelliae TaxID=2500179 RepID=A0A3S2W5T1_9PROT|nr:N-formylglutamate amidohydrolase [Hwanghaeella grinnelliae]RVU37896.1 N-formylglutamate amidohydrolase [Hwanghaeella grinnelliae]